MCTEDFLCFDDESIDQERIVTGEYHVLTEFFCPICYCLLWKPRSCASCQNLFCNTCIQTWLHTNPSTCPLCRSPYEEKPAPPSIQSVLARFSIHCRNTSLGCTEILPYDLLEQHESVKCNFLTKKCRLCEQIVLVTDIDQHKNVCKPIVVRCPSCQCFLPTGLFERHQTECLQQHSNAFEELDEELFLSQNVLNEMILPTTADIELVGTETFNQTREKNCLVRFWGVYQLMLMNLSMIHLIIFNIFGWGCEKLVYTLALTFLYLLGWVRISIYQPLIVMLLISIVFNYSLSFLLKSVNDTSIILFVTFTLIICSSISPQIRVNRCQMYLNYKATILIPILIFLLFQISLWIIRFYFNYIPINIRAVGLPVGMIWYANYF